MTPGVTVSASEFVFLGEAFSLDHRGWKAAPTGDMATCLEGAAWERFSCHDDDYARTPSGTQF